jgi:hypothetical protein
MHEFVLFAYDYSVEAVASVQFRHLSESLSNRLFQICFAVADPTKKKNGGQALISIDKKPRLLGDKPCRPTKRFPLLPPTIRWQ